MGDVMSLDQLDKVKADTAEIIDGVPYQDSGSRAGFVSPQMKAYEGGGEWGFTDDSFVRSTVLSPCPIPFEQSLKLELTGVGTGSWFHYMYTLL